MSIVLDDKDLMARLRSQRFELNKLSVCALQTETNADGGQTTTPTLYDSALLRTRDVSHPLFSSDGILSYNNWSSGFRDNSLPTIVVVVGGGGDDDDDDRQRRRAQCATTMAKWWSIRGFQMMQGNHRGSASGMIATGAPDEHLPVPSAMYGTTYRVDPNNQPIFVPGGEEKAGVEPRAAWGDDSEDEV